MNESILDGFTSIPQQTWKKYEQIIAKGEGYIKDITSLNMQVDKLTKELHEAEKSKKYLNEHISRLYEQHRIEMTEISRSREEAYKGTAFAQLVGEKPQGLLRANRKCGHGFKVLAGYDANLYDRSFFFFLPYQKLVNNELIKVPKWIRKLFKIEMLNE